MREHRIETLETLGSAILALVLGRLSARGYALNASFATKLATRSRWTRFSGLSSMSKRVEHDYRGRTRDLCALNASRAAKLAFNASNHGSLAAEKAAF